MKSVAKRFPRLTLVSDEDVYDSDLGETYHSSKYDFDGKSIEVTQDSHGYNARAEGGYSRVRMDEGGLIGFFLDLFGMR